jgi:hypothetical protein
MENPVMLEDWPKRCPPSWKRLPPTPLYNGLEDGLHGVQKNFCELKYLGACSIGRFDRMISTHCQRVPLIENYAVLANEFTRLALHGDGDRSCLYHVDAVRCELLDFRGARNPTAFIAKFQVLANEVSDAYIKNRNILDSAVYTSCLL